MRKKFRMILSTIVAVCCMGFVACSDETENEEPVKEETHVCVLSEMEISVGVDESTTLQVLGNDLGLAVEWYSSNVNIATVENGVVVGVTPGMTSVIAQVGEQKLTCEVTVSFVYDNVAYVTLQGEIETENGYALQLLKGSSYTLSPALIDGEKVENVSFAMSCQTSALTIQGTTITANALVENEQVIISCAYNGETYQLVVLVTVAE